MMTTRGDTMEGERLEETGFGGEDGDEAIRQ
jgi:hypothetical protein